MPIVTLKPDADSDADTYPIPILKIVIRQMVTIYAIKSGRIRFMTKIRVHIVLVPNQDWRRMFWRCPIWRRTFWPNFFLATKQVRHLPLFGAMKLFQTVFWHPKITYSL